MIFTVVFLWSGFLLPNLINRLQSPLKWLHRYVNYFLYYKKLWIAYHTVNYEKVISENSDAMIMDIFGKDL